jgi:nucleoside-triphosphatase THEP1
MKRKNVLFSGFPGCGKSTLIEKIVARTKGSATGFFTREIRLHGRRVGLPKKCDMATSRKHFEGFKGAVH